MQNPFKTINVLAMDLSRHHERLIHLEKFQRLTNERLLARERESTDRASCTAVAIEGMLRRLKDLEDKARELEAKTQPPVGLDGIAVRVRAEDKIIKAITQAGRHITPTEIAEVTGINHNTISGTLAKMMTEGKLVRRKRGFYGVKGGAIARAVGQRNGR